MKKPTKTKSMHDSVFAKKDWQRHDVSRIDTNSRFAEDCIEYVSQADERECLSSLGLSFGNSYEE